MNETEVRTALAREDVYRYIAACYYEPDPVFEEEGMFQSLLEAVSLAHPDLVPLAKTLGDEFRRTPINELLLDYTRLFLGPSHTLAKPYGSVWLEGDKTLMGDTTMAVLELYREGGFDVDEEFRELPDHIAVELEFLYLLVYREYEARLAEDPDRLVSATTLKKHFLSQHLGQWVTRFTDTVKAEAQSSFYQHLAQLTDSLVNCAMAQSGIVVSPQAN